MSDNDECKDVPLKMSRATNFIQRFYHGCTKGQWIREILVNAIESGAKNIKFALEWESAQNGVYRRMIADDGIGFSKEELQNLLSTIGTSGEKVITNKDKYHNPMEKAIHSNFGIGCRVSLLPINKYGLVYLSLKNKTWSMILLRYDEELQDYTIKSWDLGYSIECVIDPTKVNWSKIPDDELSKCGNINWANVVKPNYDSSYKDIVTHINEIGHGTIVVLLGDSPKDDTFYEIEGVSMHDINRLINFRFWDFPSDVTITVEMFNFNARKYWPKARHEYHAKMEGKTNTARGTTRSCKGAEYYITQQKPKQKGKEGGLESQGSILLVDGKVKLNWYLWAGDKAHIDAYAPQDGFIAVKYHNELFQCDYITRATLYRSFGVCAPEVIKNLTIILEPQEWSAESNWGIAPDHTRANLAFTDNLVKSEQLPIQDWGHEFVDKMPTEIKEQISNYQKEHAELTADPNLVKRIVTKLGERFKQIALIKNLLGNKRGGKPDKENTNGIANGGSIKPENRGGGGGGNGGGGNGGGGGGNGGGNGGGGKGGGGKRGPIKIPLSDDTQQQLKEGDSTPAESVAINRLMPNVIWGTGFEDGILKFAMFMPSTDLKPAEIHLNSNSPILLSAIEYHTSRYADIYYDDVVKAVRDTYATVLCCKVIHILNLPIVKKTILDHYLTSEALTTAAAGFYAEDKVIEQYLKKKYTKKQVTPPT